jgi:hypothetical protein
MNRCSRTCRAAGPRPTLGWAAGLGLAATLLAAAPAAAVQARTGWREDLRRVINLPVFDELGPIVRMERLERGAWLVTTPRCTVEVHIIERRLRPGMPGYGRIPPTYEPRAQTPVCQR